MNDIKNKLCKRCCLYKDDVEVDFCQECVDEIQIWSSKLLKLKQSMKSENIRSANTYEHGFGRGVKIGRKEAIRQCSDILKELLRQEDESYDMKEHREKGGKWDEMD